MESNGDLFLFLGRWHPLLVHLPIGMLIMAFFLALLDRKNAHPTYSPAVSVILLFGAASAVLASISGYLLSLGGGYDVRTLSLHQWLGISVAVVSTLCWLLYRKPPAEKDAFRPLRRFRLAFLTLMVMLIGMAGHFGGTLTHGNGYLVEALPEGMRRTMGWEPEQVIIENVQEASAYADVIQPIFRQRCQSCHGAKKQEGELALHTLEMLQRGGESGKAMVAGRADSSELYRRLTLPEGHEERMPPKGRTPITADQIKLIAWWIDAGAPADKKVKELEQPEAIQPILLALEGDTGDSDATGTGTSLADIPPADADAVEKLLAKGIKVVTLATGKHQLAINAINYPQFNDQDAQLLAALGEHIIQLKLDDTQITDSALQQIGKLPALQRLHLENTAVGNAGLAHLSTCKQLRYLNLVNTQVTDEGLTLLAQLPALQTVYLYQAGVTSQGLSRLSQARPEVQIDTGNYRLPALPTDTIVY
ncbi:c-type cytochrome domain-containing protein [Parapedobacter sp. DT-150]|uniref:c-type cytochrome domain-containing protein n=1 Tax=Parapedobacter sp. DT-150 TaxID=3396162 RepID=UPI003F1DECBD